MADPAAAFHVAQEATLRSSAALADLFPDNIARIYGTVPQNAPLPFIRIGDDQVLADDTDCASGSDVYATVHIWTRPDPPSVQLARQMAGVIRDLLADPDTFAVQDFDVIDALFIDTRHLTDPDGSTHAVMTFHYALTALS
jgi:hypothetical protein